MLTPTTSGAAAAESTLAPTRFHLAEGTVAKAHPSIGMYEVRPGLNNTSGMTIVCTTLDIARTYRENDTVIYAEAPSARLEKVGMDVRIGVIMGGYRPLALKPDQAIKNPDILISPLRGYGFDSDLLAGLFKNTMQDRSPGRTMDTHGGDFTHAGELGSFLHAGYSGSAIGASPMARLVFNALHDGARMFTMLWEHDSICHEEGHYPDLESYVFYRRRAIAASEGTGAFDVGSYSYNDEKKLYEPVADHQQGIFRNEELEGRLVDGSWRYWSIPEDAAGADARSSDKSDKPHLGIISERMKYSGHMEYRTAKGFSVVKSLYVPVPRQLVNEDDLKEQDAETKEWYDQHQDVIPYASQLAASIESEIFEYNMFNYNQERMRKRPTHWKMYTKEDLKKEYNTDIRKYENELIALPDADPEYTPDSQNELLIEDKQSGLNTKLIALMSMFKLLDDGTMVISDGHGGEIRMCRGNITITCPGDMQIMPGRDMVTMVPRRNYQVTGGDTFIHSSKGSVNIKAEKNFATLSGNGGEGATLIENRSDKVFSKETWVKGVTSGDPVNNGIVIKAKRGLGILAKNTYLGIRDQQDDSSGGLKRIAEGSITIDACGGVLATLGKYIYSRSDAETAICSSSDTGGSILNLSPSTCSLFGDRLDVGVGTLALNKSPSGLALNQLGVAGVTVKRLTLKPSEPEISIKGNVKIAGAAKVSGMMQASSVRAESGGFGNASDDSGLRGGSGPGNVSIPSLGTNVGLDASASFKAQVEQDTDLHTGQGLYNMDFFYPTTESLKLTGTRIYQARWQKMLLKGGGAVKWDEPLVTSPTGSVTRVYPGNNGWNDSLFVGILDGGTLSKTALNGNYVINCSKTGGDYGG